MGSQANIFRTTFCVNGPLMPQIALKSGRNGNWLTPSDVSCITYTVYEETHAYPRTFKTVKGHENVTIPVVSAILASPVQRPDPSGNNKNVNFEYRFSSTYPIFPNYGKLYRVRIEFTLSDGYKSVAILEGPAL